MMVYFSINILYSLVVLSAVFLMKKLPFRLRFYLLLFAMISWLIPYGLFQGIILFERPPTLIQPVLSFGQHFIRGSSALTDGGNYYLFPWLELFVVFSAFGLLLFLMDLLAVRRRLLTQFNQSIYYAKKGNIRFYAVSGLCGAHTSGFLNPIIWFDKNYLGSQQLETILQHELQHIDQKDNLWLLLITLIQRLMWWNPMVWLMATKAREYIELSCDQACAEKMGRNAYRTELARLILTVSHKMRPILSANFLGEKNFNVLRIKLLNEEYIMTVKDKLILMLGVITCVSMLGLIVTGQKVHAKLADENIVLQDNQILIELGMMVVPSEKNEGKKSIDDGLVEQNIKLVSALDEWSEVIVEDYHLKILFELVSEDKYRFHLIVVQQPGAEVTNQSFPPVMIDDGIFKKMTIGNKGSTTSLDINTRISR